MYASQIASFERLRQMKKQYSFSVLEYWEQFSAFTTWQFWACLALLIVPLIVLYFALDRSKAFHLGFYGYSVHIITFYADTFGVLKGLWDYPYKVIPHLPISLMIDASLVPVFYMLVYQWTLNHHKSPFLYTTITAAIFAFIIKPLLSLSGLFLLFDGMTFFLLFLAYMLVTVGSLLLTKLFIAAQKRRRASVS